MKVSWGYSPKIEKYIPLGDFPIDKYLVIAKQAVENLGWKLSHISANGLIAYTPLSLQSYSEEVAIKISANFAIVKSECIGIQLCFTDYGKNDQNLEKFFHEFAYVEFQLKDTWDEILAKFREFVVMQDDNYFDKALLTVKNKIKNVLYLFVPRQGYVVTPIIMYLCIVQFAIYSLFNFIIPHSFSVDQHNGLIAIRDFYMHVLANNRALVLGGQVWRLITYQFVHGNYLHLFFNMYVLVYAGLMIEHKLGAKKFLLIYLLSGCCGGLASIIAHDMGFGIGASGAIMGLSGAFIALLATHTFEKSAAKALLISTSISVLITLVSGLQNGIDNACHLGGLIAGFISTLLLTSGTIGSISLKKSARYAILAALTIAFTASVFFLTPNFHSSAFEDLREKFEKNTENAHPIDKLPQDMSTLQKIKTVRLYGIDLWERNVYTVREMEGLKLDDESIKIRSYYKRLTEKMLDLMYLYYSNYKASKPEYLKEIAKLEKEVAELKLAAKQEADIDFD